MTADGSRVLAHTLARELTAEEVDMISGGAKTATTIRIRSTGQVITDQGTEEVEEPVDPPVEEK